MLSLKVKTSARARDIRDKTIVMLSAHIGEARGLQPGDMVTISETVGRMLALATSRAAGPDSRVDVDIMVSRTKEGRRFTWTGQIDIEPALMKGDPGADTRLTDAAHGT